MILWFCGSMLCFCCGALHCCIAPEVDRDTLLELCVHVKVGYLGVISFLPCFPLASPFFTVLISSIHLPLHETANSSAGKERRRGRLPQLRARRHFPLSHLQGHNASICLVGSRGSSNSNINKGSGGRDELWAWHPQWSSGGQMSQENCLASPHLPGATKLGFRKQVRKEATLETTNAEVEKLAYHKSRWATKASAVQWNWHSFTVALTVLWAMFTGWQWLFPPHLPRSCSLVFNGVIYCFTEHEASPSATDPDHTPEAFLLRKSSPHSQA